MSWSYLNAFVCGIKLSRRLNTLSPGFPRKQETIIDYLLEHLQATQGNKYIPIQLHPRTYEGTAFYGTIEVSGSKVDIYYDRNRNRCWRRFIITKELCHLLYDTPNSQHLASSPEQIGSLLTQILAGLAGADFGKDHAVSSEQATILIAIEVLLPHSERKKVEKTIGGGGNALDVAKYYLLPEQMVAAYLDRHYAAFMDEVTKEFDKSGDR
jgi:Zn-dependent peptidase ImmA (M78 family)